MEVDTTKRDYGGRPIAECERYGKPHIHAHYTAKDNTHRYGRDDGALCVICGKPATETHHWPPLGASHCGMWTMKTPKGAFLLKPALFALCRKHHEQFHAHVLMADWVWNDEAAAEEWWSGKLLTHVRPHDAGLYAYGRWRFTWPGGGFEYREVIEDGQRKAIREPIRR